MVLGITSELVQKKGAVISGALRTKGHKMLAS